MALLKRWGAKFSDGYQHSALASVLSGISWSKRRVLEQLSKPLSFQEHERSSPRALIDYEVLIIGAGVSGIDLACHLQSHYQGRCPVEAEQLGSTRAFLVVEKRADVGGTWDLFQYPGVRSDSDMFTFGFAHRPWRSQDTLTAGAAIKQYLKQSAQASDIVSKIRFNSEVTAVSWSSFDGCWRVTICDLASGDEYTISAGFVVGATGYYDFTRGYQPAFAGQDSFQGPIIHPQLWQPQIDFDNKKIVIIGSGATAVTLLPALVDGRVNQRAAHVTMLQRSPTYVASVPSQDNGMAILSQRLGLSTRSAYSLVRWKNILTQQGLYQLSRIAPKTFRAILQYKARQDLAGSGVSLTHFSPQYDPWDERLCAVPDGDFFQALHSDRAAVVTDEIERFTPTGIKLTSGQHLAADIIITATGLQLQMLGGAAIKVDGEEVNLGDRMTYKAVLVEDIPNFAVLFGYINASWTLKIDLACDYLVRLFRFMDRYGHYMVKPSARSALGKRVNRLDDTIMGSLSAGYIRRAKEVLPKQGDRYPWFVTHNYMTDRIMLKYRRIKDNWLSFE